MLLAIFALSLAVVLANGAAIDPRCSRYSDGMEAQVLPYLLDCRKFVICDMRGNGQVLSCPKGLYFDDASHACAYETDACTHGELTVETPTVVRPIAPPVPVHPQPPAPLVKPQPQPPAPLLQPQPLPVEPAPVPVYPEPIPPVALPQPVPLPVQPPSFLPPVVAPESEQNPSVTKLVPTLTVPTTVAPSVEQQPDLETLQQEQQQQQQQSVCWDQSAGKVYPVVDDCGLYVVCMGNSKAIVQRCPKGLLYDAKQGRCDFANPSFCSTPRTDGNLVLDMHGVDMSLRNV